MIKDIWQKIRSSRIGHHLSDFNSVWIALFLLVIATVAGYYGLVRVALVVFFVLFMFKPMNAVYGLIGTKGSIRSFIILLLIINVSFFAVYYWGFFMNAGLTYDTSQPYLSYGMFKDADKDSVFTNTLPKPIKGFEQDENRCPYFVTKTESNGVIKRDTTFLISPSRTVAPYLEEEHTYHRVKWVTVLQNTVLTSLMQEPTDLFTAGLGYYDIQIKEEQNLNGRQDRVMSRLFGWILTLQVFLSWIFFGVFISILYNKFRYES